MNARPLWMLEAIDAGRSMGAVHNAAARGNGMAAAVAAYDYAEAHAAALREWRRARRESIERGGR